jgi:hypothetical protein
MENLLAILLIFGCGGGTMIAISFSPIGRAIAERIRGGRGLEAVPDPQVYEELDRMRQELGELHERVDFTERLLAAKHDNRELAEGA